MFNLIKLSTPTLRRTLSKQRINCFHDEFSGSDLKKNQIDNQKISKKFQVFQDSDAMTILDVEEERMLQGSAENTEKHISIYANLSLKRGTAGVFDIEELVDLLKRDNAENIFVCTVPKEIKYVDHMCIVSGRSFRHMIAMAEFVRKVFKLKRSSHDILPKIEGDKSKDWMALDLGNIALHIFSPATRKLYDLESLWSLGHEFDAEYNKPEEPLVELYERHSRYLQDLKPKVGSHLA